MSHMVKEIKAIPGFSEELAGAVETVNIAVQVATEAQTHLRDITRRFLMSAETDEERLLRASLVYWQMPDIPSTIIASVVLGDKKKAGTIASLLGPCPFPPACEGCGVPMPVKSRTELANRKGKRRKYLRECDGCSGRDVARAEAMERWEDSVARARELRTMRYSEYLLTEEWLQKRNQKLKQAGFKCQICNTGGLLNVHHRTYDRRGDEWMSDLTVLCRPCHAKFHDKLP